MKYTIDVTNDKVTLTHDKEKLEFSSVTDALSAAYSLTKDPYEDIPTDLEAVREEINQKNIGTTASENK